MILAYQGTPTERTVDAVAAFGDAHLGAGGSRVGALAIIRTGDAVPDARTRAAIAGLMKRFEPRIAALAQVALGSGFGAAAVRSVLAGMNLLARPAYPTHVFAEIEPAVQWICGQGLGSSAEARLVAARIGDQMAAG